ncbi:TetR/AcrR family transcriptional regulator [Cryobacterium sp. TMT1-66-1]|uniref:TetR/AcrR family transcriptional regulator n=1 Tax=Cryobacterium sp. TMT1-66-1 TaxID=1259242 RepID=UPI00106A3050|nr:TetR family transcriptional regulator [Cryobacterium sp. TMT1-66-1]TFD05979.1 TetR/AcrR family transcriptional regulator [Cryobacterium sp. TMT1-66-1]
MSSDTTLPWSDLKMSARIVAAAFKRFARDGFAAATIREIAADAGVSAALVIHHFGSKDGLRRECNRRVVDFLRDKGRPDASAAERLDAVFVQYGSYATRAVAEDSEASRELFDVLLGMARAVVAEGAESGSLRGSSDPDAQAMALLVLGLTPFAFSAHLTRWADAGLDAAMARLAVPIAEIYTRGLVTDSGLLDAAMGIRGER